MHTYHDFLCNAVYTNANKMSLGVEVGGIAHINSAALLTVDVPCCSGSAWNGSGRMLEYLNTCRLSF